MHLNPISASNILKSTQTLKLLENKSVGIIQRLISFAEEAPENSSVKVDDKHVKIFLARYVSLCNSHIIARDFSPKRREIVFEILKSQRIFSLNYSLINLVNSIGCKLAYKGKFVSTKQYLDPDGFISIIFDKLALLCYLYLGEVLSSFSPKIILFLVLDLVKQLKYEQYVNSAPESPQTTEENRILHLDPLYDATMQLDKVIYKNKFLLGNNLPISFDTILSLDLNSLKKDLLEISLLCKKEYNNANQTKL